MTGMRSIKGFIRIDSCPLNLILDTPTVAMDTANSISTGPWRMPNRGSGRGGGGGKE